MVVNVKYKTAYENYHHYWGGESTHERRTHTSSHDGISGGMSMFLWRYSARLSMTVQFGLCDGIIVARARTVRTDVEARTLYPFYCVVFIVARSRPMNTTRLGVFVSTEKTITNAYAGYVIIVATILNKMRQRDADRTIRRTDTMVPTGEHRSSQRVPGRPFRTYRVTDERPRLCRRNFFFRFRRVRVFFHRNTTANGTCFKNSLA